MSSVGIGVWILVLVVLSIAACFSKRFRLDWLMIILIAGVGVPGTIWCASIMMPNRARGHPSRNSCINNLRQMDGAIEQWALESKKTDGSKVIEAEMFEYVKGGKPACPKGGKYIIGPVGTAPRCTVPGHSL